MKLITVKESHFASELSVLKSRLESEGIPCFLEGDLTSQVLSHIPSMEAKLKVRDSDLEKVKLILIEIDELETENKSIVCPKCGSQKNSVRKSLKERWCFIKSVLSTLVNFTPVNHSYRAKDFVCEKCGHKFSL